MACLIAPIPTSLLPSLSRAAYLYRPFEVFLWWIASSYSSCLASSGSWPGVWTQSSALREDFVLPGKPPFRAVGQRDRPDHSTCQRVPRAPPAGGGGAGQPVPWAPGGCPRVPAQENGLTFYRGPLPPCAASGRTPRWPVGPTPTRGLDLGACPRPRSCGGSWECWAVNFLACSRFLLSPEEKNPQPPPLAPAL